eukprot:12416-Heterococcus_DN1.PRE.1
MVGRMLTLCLLLLALAACSALEDSSARQDSAVEQREGADMLGTDGLANLQPSFAAELLPRRTQVSSADLVTDAPSAAPTAAPAGVAEGFCPGGSVVVSGTKHDGVFIYDQDANNPAQEEASFATVYARRPLPGSKVLAFLTYTDKTAAGPASRRAAAQSPLQAAYSSVSSSDSPFSAHRAALAEQLAALTQGCEKGQFWSVSCCSSHHTSYYSVMTAS